MAENGKMLRCMATCLLLLAAVLVRGQVKFSTVTDQSSISRNQLVEVRYVAENAKKIEQFDAPSFRNFTVVQGPIQSSEMLLVNGNLIEFKALVFLLRPNTTGKLVIPGALATLDGKRMQSNAVAIDVTNSRGNAGNPRSLRLNLRDQSVEADREFVLYPNESAPEKIKKNLFVKVEVNKKTCYVNEPVVATFKLYSRLRSESRVVKRPSFNGFSVYDMVDPDNNNPSIETVNGRRYNVHVIRKSQLFPLQSGSFTLEPVEVENTVTFIKAPSEQDTYLEEIQDPYAETVQHTLTVGSNPVDITVKPLPPANQPAAFDGAVGNFSVKASLKNPLLRAGESGTLVVAISGKGNIPMINAPAVNWPDAMEAFDPSAKEEIHPDTAPLAGNKQFEYIFTARDTGNIVIPAVRFSFFDPASQTYKTDSTRPINVRVAPGDKKQPQERKPFAALQPSTRNMWLWIAGGALVTLLVIGRVVVRSRARQAASRPPAANPPPATPAIAAFPVKRDPLARARRLLTDASPDMFIKEVEAVIWNEAGERLGIPPVALNQPQVITALRNHGASENTIQSFRDLMRDCETALYIPGQTAEDLQGILTKAEQFVGQLGE